MELRKHEDFANEKCLVQTFIESRGHHVLFLPKFHCELKYKFSNIKINSHKNHFSPIERAWGQAKRHTRAMCNYNIVTLRKTVPEGLDLVSVDLIRKFFRKAREYQHAYRSGAEGKKS